MLHYDKKENKITIAATGEDVTIEAISGVFEWFIRNKEEGRGGHIRHMTKPYQLTLEDGKPVFEEQRRE